jgi:cytoskeleton protein RodZ
MSKLGPYLRQVRETKGVALEDISRATRVGRGHLEALESEQHAELPAPVFVKGFIRAYCEFLEIPPDEALALYREGLGEVPAPARSVSPGRSRPSRLGGPIAVSLLLLLVLGGALLAVQLGLRSSPKASAPSSPRVLVEPAPPGSPAGKTIEASPRPAASRPVPAPAVEATTAPALASAPAPAPLQPAPTAPGPAAAPAAAPGNQRLVVKAIETTWIRVQTDRGAPVEELLPIGAVREWSSDRRFILTVGNAGGLELTLNGERLPPLGSRGAVIRELVLPAGAAPNS